MSFKKILQLILYCIFLQKSASAYEKYSKLKYFAQILNQSISDYSSWAIEKCSNNNLSKISDCKNTHIIPPNSNITDESMGKRVLIIDDESMKFTAATRYRNRIIEVLKENSYGFYSKDNREVIIPEYIKYIFYDLLNFEYFKNIPAELLNESEEQIGELFALNNFDPYIGHGNYILNYIANNSPKSEFIIAINNENTFSNILMAADSENDFNKAKLIVDNYFLNQSSSLNSKIIQYKINYISMSFGLNNYSIKKYIIKNKFKGKLIAYINQSFYKNYIEKLLENNDALIIQANSNNITQDEFGKDAFYSDCKKNNRRIRVGYFREINKILPAEGTFDSYYKPQSNSFYCTDISINFPIKLERDKNNKYESRERSPLFSTHGIGSEIIPGKMVSSSYSVPIAIAFLIYINESNSKIFSLESLKENKNILLDPTYHKQLPIYYYGHLD